MANTPEIRRSINEIYNSLLEKQKARKAEKEELKRKKEEEEILKDPNDVENKVLSKKEKAQLALDNWKEVIIGLTGDDLEYIEEKKSKKKYKAWFGDDEELNRIISEKPKRKKKRNYNKEFEPELNMLKAIVADQNKFTIDLQKRYNQAVGPVGKDSVHMTKTIVDLAAVINASRGNSLSVLREIGNIKKTIADLYMKQKKLDSELGGEGFNTTDIGLMGSNLAANLFTNDTISPSNSIPNTSATSESITADIPTAIPMEEFDPSTWNNENLDSSLTKYEAIPHTIVVEWHKNENKARFKAIRKSDGTELVGAPVPTCQVKSFNEKDLWAKDEFDQVYKLEVVA